MADAVHYRDGYYAADGTWIANSWNRPVDFEHPLPVTMVVADGDDAGTSTVEESQPSVDPYGPDASLDQLTRGMLLALNRANELNAEILTQLRRLSLVSAEAFEIRDNVLTMDVGNGLTQ